MHDAYATPKTHTDNWKHKNLYKINGLCQYYRYILLVLRSDTIQWPPVFVCICVIYLCVGTCVIMHADPRGWDIFLYHSSPYFLDAGSLTEPESPTGQDGWSVNSGDPPVSTLPQYWVTNVFVGDLNSGPHSYVADIFTQWTIFPTFSPSGQSLSM